MVLIPLDYHLVDNLILFQHDFHTYGLLQTIHTRIKSQLEWRYNVLICTMYVFMDAYVKIDTISKLCAYSFGQQLIKYPS
jgi:hypothetical protein